MSAPRDGVAGCFVPTCFQRRQLITKISTPHKDHILFTSTTTIFSFKIMIWPLLTAFVVASMQGTAMAATAGPSACVTFDIFWNLLAFGFNGKDYSLGGQNTWSSGLFNFHSYQSATSILTDLQLPQRTSQHKDAREWYFQDYSRVLQKIDYWGHKSDHSIASTQLATSLR